MLQLKTWGYIDCIQEKPFADIHIAATVSLHTVNVLSLVIQRFVLFCRDMITELYFSALHPLSPLNSFLINYLILLITAPSDFNISLLSSVHLLGQVMDPVRGSIGANVNNKKDSLVMCRLYLH